MANLTDTTKFRQINSETLMYNADNVDTLINGLSATYAKSADVYTKDAADAKFATKEDISSVYEFKGSVATFDDLLEISNPKVGDTYNVEDTGKNYAWTGNVSSSAYEQGWDALGGIFDLSNYYTIDEVDAGLSAKVDKVEGMGLSHNDFTDTLFEKLNNVAPSAQVNVIETIKVDNTPLTVTDKTVNIDLTGKVDKVEGMGLSHNDFTDEAVAKVSGAFQTSGGTVSGTAFFNNSAFVSGTLKVSDREANTYTIISNDRFDIATTGQNFKETQYQNGQIFFDNGTVESTISIPAKSGTFALTSDIDSAVSGKVDKVEGMGLSHNDFTDTLKTKLDNIAEGAEVNQNAFSVISDGTNTASAVAKQDTFTVQGAGSVTVSLDGKTLTVSGASTDISTKADKTAFITLSAIETMPTSNYKLDDLVTKYNSMVAILKAIGTNLNPTA